MKLEWDFHELTEFADNLSNYHRLETALMTATRKIAQVLHRYLKNWTPVDTGNLRKMWSAGNNLAFTVQKMSNGYQVTLINTATNARGKKPFMYAVAVNDGHKTPDGTGWVMGRFFVENAMLQLADESTQIENIVMHELQKWWREC